MIKEEPIDKTIVKEPGEIVMFNCDVYNKNIDQETLELNKKRLFVSRDKRIIYEQTHHL